MRMKDYLPVNINFVRLEDHFIIEFPTQRKRMSQKLVMNSFWLCTMLQHLPNTKWNIGLSISSELENPLKMATALKGQWEWPLWKCAENWYPGHAGETVESVICCSGMQCVRTTYSGHPPWSLEHVRGHFSLGSKSTDSIPEALES
jgi:hypothetical protein